MNDLSLESVIGVAALLIHAAKIDEKYSEDEIILVKEFIKSYTKNENNDEIFKKAEILEKNSNQLLNFTSAVKTITILFLLSLTPKFTPPEYPRFWSGIITLKFEKIDSSSFLISLFNEFSIIITSLWVGILSINFLRIWSLLKATITTDKFIYIFSII